ncbi:MAG TPA: phosphoglycolate phosphatase [Stenotrophomonas sp.]|jgi:phosphoglycolate phosphatase
MAHAYPLVIFDLDGTLVDSLSDITEALNLTLAQWQLPQVPEPAVRGWIGEGVRVLVSSALAALGSSLELDTVMPDFMQHYGQTLLHHPRLYPGAAETLAGLQARGAQLALCTNKPTHFVAPLLAHLGIAQYFSAVLGGDSLPERKPSGAPLLHLCKQFDCAAPLALMVGDSAIDAEAAHAAGVPLALVRYGYLRGLDPVHAGARLVIDDLRELLA